MQAAVRSQQLEHAIVGQTERAVTVDADHGVGDEQAVDHGFFGRLDRGREQGVEPLGRQPRRGSPAGRTSRGVRDGWC